MWMKTTTLSSHEKIKINLVDPGSTVVIVYVSSELPNKASQSLVPIKTQVL